MASIAVDQATKDKWDEMKPADLTHDEFCQEVLKAKQRDDGQVVDVDEMVDQISKQTAASIELASYRGVREALNEYDE